VQLAHLVRFEFVNVRVIKDIDFIFHLQGWTLPPVKDESAVTQFHKRQHVVVDRVCEPEHIKADGTDQEDAAVNPGEPDAKTMTASTATPDRLLLYIQGSVGHRDRHSDRQGNRQSN